MNFGRTTYPILWSCFKYLKHRTSVRIHKDLKWDEAKMALNLSIFVKVAFSKTSDLALLWEFLGSTPQTQINFPNLTQDKIETNTTICLGKARFLQIWPG